MQSFAFGNGTIYKLGNLTANYVGIILHGADIINGKIIDICIFKIHQVQSKLPVITRIGLI